MNYHYCYLELTKQLNQKVNFSAQISMMTKIYEAMCTGLQHPSPPPLRTDLAFSGTPSPLLFT